MNSTDSKIEDSSKLPGVALIVDVPNWAFHNYAKQIAERLSHAYNFQIFFYGEYAEIEDLMFEVKDFDLVHFFWRDALFSLLSKWVRHSFDRKQMDYSDFIANVAARANTTTSVYDHLFLSESEIQERRILFNALAIGYTTCSEKLNKIYSSIPDYPPPDRVVENGVDLDMFKPANLERLSGADKEIVVGWSGNSKWGDEGVDHKGLHTIIDPAIKSLREEGYKVRGYYADRNERWIPHNAMNDYYNSIDIYVCASDTEGSSDPILEGMACGLPIISTDVGIVPEVFGQLQLNYILESRTVEELKTKLIELIKSPQKRESLSRENLESVRKRDWAKQCVKWDEFFKSMLSGIQSSPAKKKRDSIRKQMLEMYSTLESIRELESSLQQMQAFIRESQTRISELENWTVDLQGALRSSENYVSELTESNLGLHSDLAEANKQTEIERQRIVELQSEIDRQRAELDSAENTIKMMRESRFWKLRNHWVKLKNTLSADKKDS